jgi:2-polyprenyl-3-methyl-5-hydroxy-6-metoxy-1,4-benzoquinol methylase
MSFSSSDSCSDNERERWNQKYREASGAGTWMIPDPFLERTFSEYILPLFPHGGSALDLAGGAGRHSIWLAKQGWEVTLIDISETGVEQARQNAGPLASHIHFVVDDLTRFKASQTQHEVVMAFFYLERGIVSEIVKAMRPGGLLVYKTYTLAQTKLGGGPRNPVHLLEPGELSQLASGLRVLHYREEVAEKATAELVARKEIQSKHKVPPETLANM